VDAKRGKLFTKLLREVQVAAKTGGDNPEGNPRLKAAIVAAKTQSVPSDNIQRAISRGAGAGDGEQYEEITYEGYGPGGAAIMVRALTDNKNRTAAEVRRAFSRFNGSLGGSNSVAYLFKERAVFEIPKKSIDEDALLELVLEAGAEDLVEEGDFWMVTGTPGCFAEVRQALDERKIASEGEIRSIAETTVFLAGEDAQTILKLLDMLDDLDDVQTVVANFEMSEDELQTA
jgi:YebC/PmpR family DNA-binding regulatory protein